MRQIPGFFYDEATKRYFAIDRQSESFREIYQKATLAKKSDENQTKTFEATRQGLLEKNSDDHCSFVLIGLEARNPIRDLRRRNRSLERCVLGHVVHECMQDGQLFDQFVPHEGTLQDCSYQTQWLELSPEKLCMISKDTLLYTYKGFSRLKKWKQFKNGRTERQYGEHTEEHQLLSSDVGGFSVVQTMYSTSMNTIVSCLQCGTSKDKILLTRFLDDPDDLGNGPHSLHRLTKTETLFASKNKTYWTCAWHQNNMNHYYDSLRPMSSSKLMSIGVSLGGMLIDMETRKMTSPIHTDLSDIVSQVFVDEGCVWNGCRNSSVHLFDVRSAVHRTRRSGSGRGSNGVVNTSQQFKCVSSVNHLQFLEPYTLFMSTVRGDIEARDIRKTDQPCLSIQQGSDASLTNCSIYLVPAMSKPGCDMLVYADLWHKGTVSMWNAHNGDLLLKKELPRDTFLQACCTSLDHSYFALTDKRLIAI